MNFLIIWLILGVLGRDTLSDYKRYLWNTGKSGPPVEGMKPSNYFYGAMLALLLGPLTFGFLFWAGRNK